MTLFIMEGTVARCPKGMDPDYVCAKYSVLSNRSTRLLLLEQAAEIIIALHGDCKCDVCTKVHRALDLKKRI